ncbi:MAG: hypothetical protein ACXV5N_10245 [Halobacteriota archaeon]
MDDNKAMKKETLDELFNDSSTDFEHMEAPIPVLPLREQTIRYCIGVDLGLRRDHTAIAVVEAPYGRPNDERTYLAKFLTRLEHGLRYVDVAQKVGWLDEQLTADARQKGLRCCATYILDATGVGEGVSEIITAAMPKADIHKCYLTGGINWVEDLDLIKLPKTQMVSTLVALFDSERIKLPKASKESETMVEELLNYEIHVSEEGRDQYGAFKVGTHDDLVTALGLACWYAERYKRGIFW